MSPPSLQVAVGFCGGGGRDDAGNSRPPCGIACGISNNFCKNLRVEKSKRE
jgi:hypothetical protein